MRKSRLIVLLCLSLVLSVFLAACGSKEGAGSGNGGKEGSGGSKEKAPQVLNLAEAAEIPTMNTVMGDDQVSFIAFNQVFEGLMRLDKDNMPTLGMAAEEPQVNEDETVYTFKLRDAKWSNGTPVTANDFVYSWRKVVDPATAAPYSGMFVNVIKNAEKIVAGKMKPEELGIKAVDEKTLEITLEMPVPYFMSLMTFPAFYPQNQEFVESQGEKYASNSDTLIYNGPFIMKDWNGTGLSWKYEKNDGYWDKDTVKLDQINVQVVKEDSTRVNLYETGKIDRAVITGEFAQQYSKHDDYVTELTPSVFYFKFNQEKGGKKTPLANENIRRAISIAVDKESMVETILANGSPAAYGLIPKDFTFNQKSGEDFRKTNGDMNKYDVEKAKEYWKKGLSELGESKLTLEILGGDSDVAKKMDEYFKNQLETNLEGLSIKLKEVPFKVRLQLDEKQDYDIQVSGWGPDFQDPITFSDLFVTGGDHNLMSYSNKDYDKLIKDAKTTLAGDQEKRWEALLESEKILIEKDAAIAPIYQKANAALQQKYVKDIYKHPFGPDYSFKWTYIEK